MTESSPSQNQPTLLVFCDEAGNSGDNLLDSAQPVYVIAGWAVEPQKLVQVEDVVRSYRSKAGYRAEEMKGNYQLRRKRFQRMYAGFLKAIGEAGAWPVYAIFEKRFWIAGRIVEALFDNVHNPHSSVEFFSNFEAKRNGRGPSCGGHQRT